MNDFTDTLQLKVDSLEDQCSELEDEISRVRAKIETLQELIEEEGGTPAPKKSTKPRSRKSRKRTAKAAPDLAEKRADPDEFNDILREASSMEGTDPEIAARLSGRKSSGQAGPRTSYGPGVHPDSGKKPSGDGETKSDKSITVEDEVANVPV